MKFRRYYIADIRVVVALSGQDLAELWECSQSHYDAGCRVMGKPSMDGWSRSGLLVDMMGDFLDFLDGAGVINYNIGVHPPDRLAALCREHGDKTIDHTFDFGTMDRFNKLVQGEDTPLARNVRTLFHNLQAEQRKHR